MIIWGLTAAAWIVGAYLWWRSFRLIDKIIANLEHTQSLVAEARAANAEDREWLKEWRVEPTRPWPRA